jgi:hypothetical protein
MRTHLLVTVALTVSLFWTIELYAQDGLLETTEQGKTDWVEGYVEASGQGTSRYMGNRIQEELMAKQAARTSAQSRLLETINGVRLTGLSTLGTQGQGDMRAASRIKGVVRGARVVSETVTWQEDKSSRRGEVPLAEVILRLCMSAACKETQQNLTTTSLADPSAPSLVKDVVADQAEGPSAVIIDLEKALYLPALAPEIINEDGEIVYSQDSIDEAALEQSGIVNYSKSVIEAKNLSISGANPIILKAERITKDNRIVLSNTNSAQIKGISALRLARVIVAMD